MWVYTGTKMKPNRKYLTVAELADLLRLNPITVANMARAGRIPSYKFGGRVCFTIEDVEAYIKSRRRPSRDELADEAARRLSGVA